LRGLAVRSSTEYGGTSFRPSLPQGVVKGVANSEVPEHSAILLGIAVVVLMGT
jgi:hypothetical protein